MKAVSIVIEGRVQGVCFRACAEEEALRAGVRGFVRNQADGTVYAEAEGDDGAVDRFVAWCRRGPPAARVTRVAVRPLAPTRCTGFRIAP